jgi:4-carboxymuconolactone decarboxylase
MSRMRMLTTKDELPESAHATFDAIATSRGRVGGPFAVLLHSPEVAERTAHLGAYIRFESSLDAAVRELATIATAHECRCAYEWGAHETQAQKAGVDPRAIEAVANDGSVEALTPEDALVIRFVRDLVNRHQVDDATFAEIHAHFGEQGVAELTATIGYYSMLACVLNAAAVEPA